MKKKVAICIGTRPEAIKMAPVVKKFQEDGSFEVSICVTGQHTDMVNDILTFFDIVPDVLFHLTDQVDGLSDLLSQLMRKMDEYLLEFKPDIVVAQGDTTSVLAAALSAYYHRIPFGHVEAGLRTGNKYAPWPEEGNRSMISSIATFHFAPTELNRSNLLAENICADTIHVTGNTVVDSLHNAIAKIDNETIKIPSLDISLENKKMILITGHRRENIGKSFDNIFSAIAQMVLKYPDATFIYPVHMNPQVRAQVDMHLRSAHYPNLYLIEPVGYPEFVYLMKKAHFIVTDSGGIQEEAPTLGTPVLVTRENTERPEGVTAGVVKLVGTKKESIINACVELLEDKVIYDKMISVNNPYGDGLSSDRIVEILKTRL